MYTSRRDVFKGALTAGLAAGLPSLAADAQAPSASLKATYARLDAAAKLAGV